MVHNTEKPVKPATATSARKRKTKPEVTSSEPKNIKLLENECTGTISPCPLVKPKKSSKKKKLTASDVTHNELSDRFPILKNSDLVNKFLSVPMSNNQKGRIRQILKDSLRGTSEVIMPEVIHTKILNILKSSSMPYEGLDNVADVAHRSSAEYAYLLKQRPQHWDFKFKRFLDDLTDTELRKIRILYNMLKTASLEQELRITKRESRERKSADSPLNSRQALKKMGEDKHKGLEKVKSARRHVVFVGNLPFDVTKDKLMDHFSEIAKDIVDVRLPKPEDEKKSAIAYIEIKDDHNFEYALSKHHTMLGNRRINVLYTTQLNSKISKAEAKSKSAKMIALQKQGKLLGSVPLARKRSARRKKMKVAQAKEAAEEEAKHRGPQSMEKPKFWQGNMSV